MSLTNYQISDLCEYYQIPIEGIFMKDELKRVAPKNGLYIVNLDSITSGKGGTHWTFIALHDTLGNIFYDSFGAIPAIEVEAFIRRSKMKTFAYNNWITQDIRSEYCGFFCLALAIYLKYHFNGQKTLSSLMNDYVNIFVDDTKRNDGILKDFFRKRKPHKIVNAILLK